MIRLVSKEQFYQNINPKTEFYTKDLLCEIKGWREDIKERCCYYRKGNIYFIYLHDSDKLLIPKSYSNPSFIADRISRDRIGFDDWKIEKINEEVPYTLNVYKRYHNSVRGDLTYYGDEKCYEQGTYKLVNTETQAEIEFSIRLNKCYWFENLLAFDGVQDLKTPDSVIKEKNDFIKTLLKINGKNFKSVNSKS